MKDRIQERILLEQELRPNSRRDQIAIISDLLKIIKQPQKLTHILYKSNMSYGQLIKYLADMIDLGIATEQKKPFRAFSITSNGEKFLEVVEKRKSSISLGKFPY